MPAYKPKPRLTEEQVSLIREALKTYNVTEISKQTPFSISTISRIATGKTHKKKQEESKE